jgi:hypothetical protein
MMVPSRVVRDVALPLSGITYQYERPSRQTVQMPS